MLKRGWSPAHFSPLRDRVTKDNVLLADSVSLSEEELTLVQNAGEDMTGEQPVDCSVRSLRMLVTHMTGSKA